MRYAFDSTSNAFFIQIFGTTETHASGETPFGFQLRHDSSVLNTLKSATEEVIEKIHHVDANFHDSPEARFAFEYGFSVFRQSVTPICYVVQQRKAFLSIGGRSVGGQSIDLQEFLFALKEALHKVNLAEMTPA